MPNPSNRYTIPDSVLRAMNDAIARDNVHAGKLARKLGIAGSTLSAILSGKQKTTLHALELCDALHIPRWQLFPLRPEERKLLAGTANPRTSAKLTRLQKRWLKVLDEWTAVRGARGLDDLIVELETRAQNELLLHMLSTGHKQAI